MASYRIYRDNAIEGPYELPELLALKLPDETLICEVGEMEWQAIGLCPAVRPKSGLLKTQARPVARPVRGPISVSGDMISPNYQFDKPVFRRSFPRLDHRTVPAKAARRSQGGGAGAGQKKRFVGFLFLFLGISLWVFELSSDIPQRWIAQGQTSWQAFVQAASATRLFSQLLREVNWHPSANAHKIEAIHKTDNSRPHRR